MANRSHTPGALTAAAGAIGLLALMSGGARALAAGGGSASAPGVAEKPAGVELKVQETVLYRIPGDVRIADTIASPDARHVACVESRVGGADRTFDVCLDSTPGPRVSWVVGRSLLFSAEGTRLTWQTQQDGPISVVIESVSRWLEKGAGGGAAPDTEPSPKGYWMAGHVIFSPDGRRCAYPAQIEKGRHVMVVDGVESPVYDGLDEAQTFFSPTANHLVYRARVGNRQLFVLDGVPQPAFEGVLDPVFSANGARFGYHVRQGQYEFYVIDGKPGPGYDVVGGLAFSADGRRYAYAGGKAGRQSLVVDGKAFKPFDGLGDIAFSPDGHRVAISAQTGNKWSAVVDGKSSAPWDGVAALQFSPDSQSIAFVAGSGWRQLVVHDDHEGPRFDGVTAVTFSADSRRLAYLALDRQGKSLIADGHKVGPADAFAFSPDGRHLAYTVQHPDGRWGLAVDGTEAEGRYEGFPLGSQIVFDSADAFRIVGGRGNEMLRIDMQIR